MLPLLLAVATIATSAPPAPGAPLPTRPAAVAAEVGRTDDQLRGALDAWQAADPALNAASPPNDVQLWALHQQRLFIELRDHPALRASVMKRLRGALARSVASTLAAMIDLRRLAPAHPPKRTWRVGPSLPAGRLLAYYHLAQRRFGVGWNLLAAVNFVETGFNKLRNNSTAGAQGPMQFLPATWKSYGFGGDIHNPRDAILGAANYLRASGAPRENGSALYHYNPSTLYVDAVLHYARRMAAGRDAFLAYYAWQVFVREPDGRLRRLTGPR